MSKQCVILYACLLALCGIFCSCKSNSSKKGALEFTSIHLSKTEHLLKDTASPACLFILDYTYPIKSSDKSLSDSLNAYFISACFGEVYKGKELIDVINQYAKEYADEYREDLESMYLEDKRNREVKDMIIEWYSYSKSIKSKVLFYEKNLLVYRVDKEIYTGGAHGIYESVFYNFDLAKFRRLHLDDIFEEVDKDVLTDLLWNQLMADNNVKSRGELEEMGYGSTGDLVPSDNFYLDKEGISFYYNVYEFTPYVMGPTEIKLSYEKVGDMLNLKGIYHFN